MVVIMSKYQPTVQCGGLFQEGSACGDVIEGMEVGMNMKTFGPVGAAPVDVGLPATIRSCTMIHLFLVGI